MSIAITCPYCNSQVWLDAPAGPRLTCARCSESFPVAGSTLPTSAAVPTATRQPTQRINRRFALVLLAMMLVLAAGAAAFMLATRSKRGLKMLAEHPALSFLPNDTNVILAMDMPLAEKTEDGKAMVDRLGLGSGGFLSVERLSSLSLNEIESSLVGLRVDGNLIPRIRVVIQTRAAYDPEKLRDRLGVKATRKQGDRDYDVVQPPGFLLEGALWCASSRTFVICFPPDDLAGVPTEPALTVDRFAPPIADLLRYRSDRDTFFWLVAHTEDWNKTALPLVLRFPADERKLVFQTQTFGLGIRMDKGLVASRNRPARITEEIKSDARGIAIDLVLGVRPGADLPAIREGLEGWVERHKLQVRDSTISENRYSASLVGSASEWEGALASLRDKLPKR